MTQLTIRFGEDLERCIRSLAEREQISLNQATLRLLRKGAGLDSPQPAADVIGDALDDLIGTWSDEEADSLRKAVSIFEAVDDELWR